jgi:hypothetical protein
MNLLYSDLYSEIIQLLPINELSIVSNLNTQIRNVTDQYIKRKNLISDISIYNVRYLKSYYPLGSNIFTKYLKNNYFYNNYIYNNDNITCYYSLNNLKIIGSFNTKLYTNIKIISLTENNPYIDFIEIVEFGLRARYLTKVNSCIIDFIEIVKAGNLNALKFLHDKRYYGTTKINKHDTKYKLFNSYITDVLNMSVNIALKYKHFKIIKWLDTIGYKIKIKETDNSDKEQVKMNNNLINNIIRKCVPSRNDWFLEKKYRNINEIFIIVARSKSKNALPYMKWIATKYGNQLNYMYESTISAIIANRYDILKWLIKMNFLLHPKSFDFVDINNKNVSDTMKIIILLKKEYIPITKQFAEWVQLNNIK